MVYGVASLRLFRCPFGLCAQAGPNDGIVWTKSPKKIAANEVGFVTIHNKTPSDSKSATSQQAKTSRKKSKSRGLQRKNGAAALRRG